MRKYFFRQMSTLWFDRYMTFCGIVLNALAIVSVVTAAMPRPGKEEARRYHRARVELEDSTRCDQLMANAPFEVGKDFELTLGDRTRVKMSYKDKGTHSRTKEGFEIHMVEADRVGFLFFEVDDKKIIRRCIPASMLECVAASGSIEKNGDCLLAVNLPSDCELMKGRLKGELCHVPAKQRILKPVARAQSSSGKGKICVTPDCESETKL